MVYDQAVPGFVTLPDGACVRAKMIVAVVPLDKIEASGKSCGESHPPRVRVDIAHGDYRGGYDSRIINCESDKQRDTMVEQIMYKIKCASPITSVV